MWASVGSLLEKKKKTAALRLQLCENINAQTHTTRNTQTHTCRHLFSANSAVHRLISTRKDTERKEGAQAEDEATKESNE